ncbi:MAG: SET domain-containing protein [Ignavibacteria bacterium]|nr:SET domain-containing protein [Ignavibacteria bacterium]MBP6509841.1 SET domain-containing protein [Candidatus Kapabacteria bacterium]MBK6419148.1 SET domain-containing protein [Ignavibacteria bacterium]MBK6760162.1 SET domain-containing protein [Ignavibacteria bacterium]MBK7034095.1 SET domain-containing protein [Ignavibacteria bacterium]
MKRHSVNVTRRCAHVGDKGRCKRMTTITHPFCGPHTREHLGITIQKSNIPKAGLGMFAMRTFVADERIVEYSGEKLTTDQYDRRYDKDNMGSYGIQLSEKYVIDARKTSSGVARYACDYHGSGKKPNAEYVNFGGRIWIVATKRIKPGEEILTDYGDDMHRALGLE